MAKKCSLIVLVILVGCFFALINSPKAHASTISRLSDTITTSRPSAASPLSADAGSSVTSVSIFNNGSRFLASDSAKIMRTSSGANIVTTLTVATQSSALTTVNFTTTTGTAAQNGTDVVIANQTAMHTISFSNPQPIPSGGKIIITFPGTGLNTASPSATTFALNGKGGTSTDDTGVVKVNGVTCSALTGDTTSVPKFTCTTSGTVTTGTTITFLIGCSSAAGASCTTQSPFMINPTKTAINGTADTWSVLVQTQDGSSNLLDQGTTKIATQETVLVRASVDPTFTFTIGGIANSSNVKLGNATGCTTTDTLNTGFASLPDVVDLGSLPISTTINTSAQLMTVTTNAPNGYSITATSSGQLQNKSTGFAIASSTGGSAFPASTPWFGIRACGTDANTGLFGASSLNTTRGSGAIYAWPTQTTAITLASKVSGPIDPVNTTNGLVTVEYAAAADANTPSGAYDTAVTYVATPVF